MTDDEHAFIRAAQAEPDEDTLRLAYADWLDEQGEGAHAAFARLQVCRSRAGMFDPGRSRWLGQERAALQKHQRRWNGRAHRLLCRLGFTGTVGTRRGGLRGWDYHRGMIAALTVEAGALAADGAAVLALGPVAHLRLATWPTHQLPPLPVGVKVVSVAGSVARDRSFDLRPFAPVAGVPVLDLRRAGPRLRPDVVFPLVRAGALSPVVLCRATRGQPWPGPGHDVVGPCGDAHIVDPDGKWGALRLPFADLTGELLTPLPYQGASR
ncbi:TIGR02996 domain-containing protein [Gemmata sp. JC673]|uniref:TIGR02996 domain-containing protein n=1 Tax=Gemmata algarum TaxID=2975278 RepID=A0ABU5F1G8_9BACT|nr:TIGR02996 domain-containing protein [Gemmata algarum]MDY3560580.1 TIGR02996 domain-containing protein [Gemmata algarum]